MDFGSSTIEKQMEDAYNTCGFGVFTNVYDSWLSDFLDWRQLREEFFTKKNEIKIKYKYSGVEDNLAQRAKI